MRMRTSPAAGAGVGHSSQRNASAAPNRSTIIAFIGYSVRLIPDRLTQRYTGR